MNRQTKKDKKNALKAVRSAAVADPAVGCHGHVASAGGCRWPVDIGELADRILQAPSKISNHDRGLVAKMLPMGTLTRRDGSSIRPRYRDLANA